MSHSLADTVVVHPRSRRAVHEARLDAQREVDAAATMPARLAARFNSGISTARVLVRSLPTELAAIPAGDAVLRAAALVAAVATILVAWHIVRPFNPDWLMPVLQSPVWMQALVWLESGLRRLEFAWPVALIWYASRPMPPLALAVVAGALAAGLCGLPTVYFVGQSEGPMLPRLSWTPLLTAATPALLAASIALVGSLVVRIHARTTRALLTFSMCGGWFLWTWVSDFGVQGLTRAVYGRPLNSPLGVLAGPGSLAGIFAVEQTALTHVGFAVVMGLMALLVSRRTPDRPEGPELNRSASQDQPFRGSPDQPPIANRSIASPPRRVDAFVYSVVRLRVAARTRDFRAARPI